jgi:hypothetical protein
MEKEWSHLKHRITVGVEQECETEHGDLQYTFSPIKKVWAGITSIELTHSLLIGPSNENHPKKSSIMYRVFFRSNSLGDIPLSRINAVHWKKRCLYSVSALRIDDTEMFCEGLFYDTGRETDT